MHVAVTRGFVTAENVNSLYYIHIFFLYQALNAQVFIPVFNYTYTVIHVFNSTDVLLLKPGKHIDIG